MFTVPEPDRVFTVKLLNKLSVPFTARSVPDGKVSLKPKPPAPMVVDPEKSAEPVKFSVPSPVLVRLPEPVISPAYESVVAASTSMVAWDAPMVIPRLVARLKVTDVFNVPPLMVR